MVAYHFPPLAGGSGIQRTLRFVTHLPAFGWESLVLTAHPRAYELTGDDLSREVPRNVHVERAFALDTARHLAIKGRYPGFLACPDRWITWRVAAVWSGLRLIREFRPDAIWSTYPIATAHIIGRTLHDRSGLPWIADFRDPMAQEGYPADPRVRRSFERIEERAIRQARFCVFTTPGAARTYRERYPGTGDRIAVIENGYDEESFSGWADDPDSRQPLNPGAITLLHSGVVYPSERDPSHLFAALKRLSDDGTLRAGRLKIRFRAAGHDDLLRSLTTRHEMEDFIELAPPIPYRAALQEMVRADALLVLQASNCNEQIPAKLYEYLRAGRPILGFTDPDGDTAGLLRAAGLDTVARLDSPDEIAALLKRFLDEVPTGRARVPISEYVARASRREQAGALASLLDRACAGDHVPSNG